MPTMWRTFVACGAMAALWLAGVVRGEDQTVPTFHRDVAPILFAHCSTCHRPGQIGPFPLTNYEEAAAKARQIALVTERRIMPPWQPEADWGEFQHARTLAEDQIATLAAWAAGGKPAGDSADAPPFPEFRDGWQLGEPDLVLTMAAPFTVPAEGRDVYVHFVFPLDLPRDKYLRGIEVIPGNRRVAHHAVGMLDTSGTARRKVAADGGDHYVGNAPGFLPAGFTPGYAPGQTPRLFEDGGAITLRQGSDFVLQMHYHPTGREETDQTQVGFYFGDEPPQRSPSLFLLGSVDIDIPPGEPAYRRADSFRLPVDYEVRSIWAHMHLIGKDVRVWAELPDGSERRLLHIGRWDFNWQDGYLYREPFVLPKGTVVRAEFTWDNSADNPRNPFDPPQRITEGEQSTNEMGGIIVGGVPVDPAKEWLHWLGVIAHYFVVEAGRPRE